MSSSESVPNDHIIAWTTAKDAAWFFQNNPGFDSDERQQEIASAVAGISQTRQGIVRTAIAETVINHWFAADEALTLATAAFCKVDLLHNYLEGREPTTFPPLQLGNVPPYRLALQGLTSDMIRPYAPASKRQEYLELRGRVDKVLPERGRQACSRVAILLIVGDGGRVSDGIIPTNEVPQGGNVLFDFKAAEHIAFRGGSISDDQLHALEGYMGKQTATDLLTFFQRSAWLDEQLHT